MARLPDAVLVSLGRHLTTLADVDEFERVAQRPVPGLYPALFGGRLEQALAQPLASIRTANDLPDAGMRHLLRASRAPIFADAWSINSKPIAQWRDVDEANFKFWRTIANEPDFHELPLVRQIGQEWQRRDREGLKNRLLALPRELDAVWDYLDTSPGHQEAAAVRDAAQRAIATVRAEALHIAELTLSAARRFQWPDAVELAAQLLLRQAGELSTIAGGQEADALASACQEVAWSASDLIAALEKTERREPWHLGAPRDGSR